MLSYAILLWILLTMHAPAWCYVCLAISFAMRMVEVIIKAKNTD